MTLLSRALVKKLICEAVKRQVIFLTVILSYSCGCGQGSMFNSPNAESPVGLLVLVVYVDYP